MFGHRSPQAIELEGCRAEGLFWAHGPAPALLCLVFGIKVSVAEAKN